MINKDTKMYGSFSDNPGNNGCTFFNTAFERQKIDAIYKSFYGDDIVDIITSVKTLGFSGFALSMPFKRQIIKYLDSIDDAAKEIGAVNTVVIENGKLIGYNTDWIGVKNYCLDAIDTLTILGNGGFSKAVQYFCIQKGIPYTVITRKDWGEVYDLKGYVFNATPIPVVTKGLLIDGRPTSSQGKTIATLQAKEQFKIYTGIDYEDSLVF
jgi:shikimate 5-dehydrogenase